jgi:3',5'-cyclic AMP phosphodiesterase CpdA
MRDINDPSLGQLSINYRDAQILILNTNFKQLDDFFIRQQWQWLESKLAEAQQNNKISFIVSHHSAFSSSLEHYRSIPRRLRKEFIPILDKFSHQMVVLSGHLHMYERSFRNGVHYIIAGPSGGMFNPPTNINPHMKVLKPFVSTFTTLTFGKGQVIIKTINQKREVIDQLVIKRK